MLIGRTRALITALVVLTGAACTRSAPPDAGDHKATLQPCSTAFAGTSDNDIWAVSKTFDLTRRLTRDGRSLDPSISPDGTTIAYRVADLRESGRGSDTAVGGEPGIFLMDLDVTNRRRLTTGRDSSPDWSADGRRIVFARAAPTPDETGFVMVVDADGGEPTEIGRGQAPDWSPDGSHVLFVAEPNRGGFWIADASGANRRRIELDGFPDAYTFRWSADGTRVAFHTWQQLYDDQGNQIVGNRIRIVDVASGAITEVPGSGAAFTGNLLFWTSDDELIFQTNRRGRNDPIVSSKGGRAQPRVIAGPPDVRWSYSAGNSENPACPP